MLCVAVIPTCGGCTRIMLSKAMLYHPVWEEGGGGGGGGLCVAVIPTCGGCTRIMLSKAMLYHPVSSVYVVCVGGGGGGGVVCSCYSYMRWVYTHHALKSYAIPSCQ